MAALFAAFLMQDHSKCLFHGKSCQKGNSKEKIPLPKCIHKIMNKQDIGNQDILVIGDVHGCLDELQLLIIKANELTANNCVFIFCGDLINKGPSSKETLDFVRNLGSKAFVIRGNNEDRVLKHCLASKNNPNYISSLKSRYHWLPELTDDDIEYLIDLPYTISIPDLNTVIVHAGLNPWIPLCLQSLDDMVHMRNITGIDNACRVQPQSDIHQVSNVKSLLSNVM